MTQHAGVAFQVSSPVATRSSIAATDLRRLSPAQQPSEAHYPSELDEAYSTGSESEEEDGLDAGSTSSEQTELGDSRA